MSNQRPSFAKRDREAKLKDKARAKSERRAAKRAAKVTSNDVPGTDNGAMSDGLLVGDAADGDGTGT